MFWDALGRLISARPQPNESTDLVGHKAPSAFLLEGEKICLLFGRGFISWNVVDSVWAGVITVALDVPPGVHSNVLVPIRRFFGGIAI